MCSGLLNEIGQRPLEMTVFIYVGWRPPPSSGSIQTAHLFRVTAARSSTVAHQRDYYYCSTPCAHLGVSFLYPANQSVSGDEKQETRPPTWVGRSHPEKWERRRRIKRRLYNGKRKKKKKKRELLKKTFNERVRRKGEENRTHFRPQ